MQRGHTSKVGRAMRAAAVIGLVVATIGVGLVGGVEIAQASSGSAATGPAGTPHNEKAYIFDEFGLLGGDTDILTNIDAGLTDEGYKVTFLRDQTEGAGSPGSVTLGGFEAMARANPGWSSSTPTERTGRIPPRNAAARESRVPTTHRLPTLAQPPLQHRRRRRPRLRSPSFRCSGSRAMQRRSRRTATISLSRASSRTGSTHRPSSMRRAR